MNRTLIALLAALESFLAVAIGVGISLIPLSIMWAARLDLDIGWEVFWRASADIWLVGHGVDLTITLDPALAAAIALPGAELPFLVSIAPLSFALITILMGVRLGRKSLESGARFVGPVAAISTFGGLTVLIAISAVQTSAMPTMWMALSFPTAFFALGVFIGARGEVGHSGGRAERVQKRVVGWAGSLPQQVRVVCATAVRGGVIVATSVIALSAVTLAVLVIVNFSTILGLYEGLQGGGGGSLILTAAQLMFMPNFVIWVASWFIGTGFALGTGSLVSPVGTDLGLLPSLPVLGALPTADMAFGFLGLLVPIASAFIAGLLLRPKLMHALGTGPQLRWMVAAVVGIALVGGFLIGFMSWASGGAAGPGRLMDVGPNALRTGGIAAIEFFIAASLGMLASSRSDHREPREKSAATADSAQKIS